MKKEGGEEEKRKVGKGGEGSEGVRRGKGMGRKNVKRGERGNKKEEEKIRGYRCWGEGNR